MLKVSKLFPHVHYPVDKGRNGFFTISYGKKSIKNQIIITLLTRIGERVHNTEFGSRIFELIYEQNDVVLDVMIREYVVEALQRWVPSIEILSTTIYRNSNKPNNVNVSLKYLIKKPILTEDNVVLNLNRIESKIEVQR